MLSALLSTFMKLPFVIKKFVLSIFEWPFYTGFTVCRKLALHHKCWEIENWFFFLLQAKKVTVIYDFLLYYDCFVMWDSGLDYKIKFCITLYCTDVSICHVCHRKLYVNQIQEGGNSLGPIKNIRIYIKYYILWQHLTFNFVSKGILATMTLFIRQTLCQIWISFIKIRGVGILSLTDWFYTRSWPWH